MKFINKLFRRFRKNPYLWYENGEIYMHVNQRSSLYYIPINKGKALAEFFVDTSKIF